MDCFEELPAEIKFHIFEQLDSLSDAASLVGASPSVRACYQANRDKLLGHNISYIREIFYNDELIPLALMVARIRRRLQRRRNIYPVVRLLEHYIHGGHTTLFRLKFENWEKNLAQIQDLVNRAPRFWSFVRRHATARQKDALSFSYLGWGTTDSLPHKDDFSPELLVFLFTPNFAGNRLPDNYTASVVDLNVYFGRLGAKPFQVAGFDIEDLLPGPRMSRDRKHEIQSWRDKRKKAWKEEDEKAGNGQMVVYDVYGELLSADEVAQMGQVD
ncbi:hypothetical protein FVEG_15289 [Fusarium verticillioides 7600]|uniref:F-box domain-containing protein n=1 Tax=Gibberella moniliformis (strain M3125 / FGSC 7600) TaxID=334819 RepID=W7LS92_GIBM7|nr:hypothetical protein FVEG_15289 [Fusarium verticillioides 7600]EWG41416.1 hypothetical protein FVEG_15289 [Fusarium verticillioides 7600]